MKRRAAGRAHYNSWRRDLAVLRRMKILDLMIEKKLLLDEWGVQARLAETLGVSGATICRDFKEILGRARGNPSCPLCRAEL